MMTQQRRRIDMYPQLTKKQFITLIATSLLVIALILTAIIVTTKKNASSTPPATPTVQIDSGLAALVARGMTSDQLSATKNAFTLFAKQNNKPVESLRVDTNSIRHHFDSNTDTNNFQFTVTDWSGNNINARVDLSGLSAAKLTLTDKKNQPLFTSEVIDLRASGIE